MLRSCSDCAHFHLNNTQRKQYGFYCEFYGPCRANKDNPGYYEFHPGKRQAWRKYLRSRR